ncbi:pyrroline-5-carboxylate reductase [Legionella sp. CNM-4043-24]|uniref:pyrroline-5-carboxylate reductase n=1 Tax=Legionella sp. CNM-4043-24 TaxID=3421646 RepID=UPI00403ACBA9
MKNICFIGYGNMAKSIAKGLRQQPGYRLSASSPSLSQTVNDEGIHTSPDNDSHLAGADVLVLAVKPARVAEVLAGIKDKIPADCVLLSIAAGISLDSLAGSCRPGQAIVRCMPNIPIAVGKGATPLIANRFVNDAQKHLIDGLFQCSGLSTWIDRESDMNAFTALSGSGPAYVYLFMEAMQSAAEKLGLSSEQAHAFTRQTLSGAVALLEQSAQSPEELRKKVTSPAGTTAAAVAILQQRGLDALLLEAMTAAHDRAEAMGREHKGS